MPQTQMSLKEKLAIGMKSFELEKAGKTDEALLVRKTIPLSPYLAKWAKEKMGSDFLIQQGFNLTEAEMEYGPDWLSC